MQQKNGDIFHARLITLFDIFAVSLLLFFERSKSLITALAFIVIL